jgi:glycosyltransferase involved in cell wall biosynthesis
VVTTDAHDLEYFWDRGRLRISAPPEERLNGVTVIRVPLAHLPMNQLLFPGGRRLMGEASRLLRWEPPFEWASRWLPRVPSLAAVIEERGPWDLVHGMNLGIEGLPLAAERSARRQSARFTMMPFVHLGVEGDPVPRRYVSMPHQVALLRRTDLVLTMTDVESSYLTRLGVDAEHLATVGAGFDPLAVTGGDGERFRARYRLGDGFLVGCLGAMARDKGTPDLVQAVAELRSTGRTVQLVLAGPALSWFDRWFQRLPPADREGIHRLGFVDDSVRRDMLAAIDVLALPSRTESFGHVFVEAWANGKSVIAAEAGAVPEIVRHESNGLLVRFGDSRSIAAAIARLMDDHQLASRLGAAGKVTAMDRYTWDAVIGRTFDAIDTMLGYSVRVGSTNA